jgi:hypothetical protein
MRLDKRDHASLALWATNCTEHVLPYFEEKCPKDDRPRRAVEARRAWSRGEIGLSEARAAAIAVPTPPPVTPKELRPAPPLLQPDTPPQPPTLMVTPSCRQLRYQGRNLRRSPHRLRRPETRGSTNAFRSSFGQ